MRVVRGGGGAVFPQHLPGMASRQAGAQAVHGARGPDGGRQAVAEDGWLGDVIGNTAVSATAGRGWRSSKFRRHSLYRCAQQVLVFPVRLVLDEFYFGFFSWSEPKLSSLLSVRRASRAIFSAQSAVLGRFCGDSFSVEINTQNTQPELYRGPKSQQIKSSCKPSTVS